ncbi:hypothetical protein, partial [Bacteroides xylanisolvens]|uniref:hypothetical protein n=1 Tax=Bacteroides xylanisolvens TaxID=371601 RepID=UPI00351359AB
VHFRFKSDAKVRHFLNSANISCIIFQESFHQIKKHSDYQQIIIKTFFLPLSLLPVHLINRTK